MAFDLNTASPVGGSSSGFDLSTAQPIGQQQPQGPQDDPLETDPLSLIPDAAGQPEPQEESSFMEKAIGAGETALTLGTGATGGAVGFLGGSFKQLASEIASGNFGTDEAADRIERAAAEGAASFTYEPKSEEGKKQVEAVGEVMQQMGPLAGLTPQVAAVGSAIKAAGPAVKVSATHKSSYRPQDAGKRLINKSGTPTPVLEKALEKQGLVYENLQPEAKALIPEIAGQKPKSIAEKALVEQLKTGGKDDSLAMLKASGNKAVADKPAIEAVRQGYDPGLIQAVKTASPATKKSMNKMLTMTQRIKKNRRLAMDMRPTDVVGGAVAKRITHIRNAANKAREDLDRIAKTELKGVEVDAGMVNSRFRQSMDDLNIDLEPTESGGVKPVFRGSLISTDGPAQKTIKSLVSLLNEDSNPDALRFHNMKRQLDNMIDWRKKSSEGLSEAGRNVLKDIRSSLNEAVRKTNDDYARTNDVLSEALTTLDDFQKVSGSQIDIFGKGSSAAIGQDMRGLMSNRKSRVRLENALGQVDETAKNLGGKFGEDIKDLALFADGLEDKFGAVARTSFKGEIESGIQQAMEMGPTKAAASAGIKKLSEAAEKARGINDFNAFGSMRRILNRN
jgi:hypothetical protein